MNERTQVEVGTVLNGYTVLNCRLYRCLQMQCICLRMRESSASMHKRISISFLI